MSLNLISGSKLEKAGCGIVVHNGKCDIINLKGEVLFSTKLVDGLYGFFLKDFLIACDTTHTKAVTMVARAKKASMISTRLDVELLHKRFGHASIDDLITGLQAGAITGYSVDAKREW